MSERFTVFGAAGFLGRHLCSALERQGHRVLALGRDNWPARDAELGHIVFTIGMNANFRGRPFETYDAHIDRLREVLTRYRFSSLLYVSSTRVYLGASSTREYEPLTVQPALADQTFNISKLAGEALCLSSQKPSVRVARLSNAYGADDRSDVFLAAVLREAIKTGSVTFHTAPASSKDYIHIDCAANALVMIALQGRQTIYNVASGINTTNQQIASALTALGVGTRFAESAPQISFPIIDTSALQSLGFRPTALGDAFGGVFEGMKRNLMQSA